MSGSSPLTRGKHERPAPTRRAGGLIPAHAGKTWGCADTRGRGAAHPRSRGENPVEHFTAACMAGSSPLTRGKRGGTGGLPLELGLIPAHAGKTPTRARTATWRWAHPRKRGENFGPSPKALRLPGSSPLTRGKQLEECLNCVQAGLIPAHAGKTTCTHALASRRRAHPRSRGENSIASVHRSITTWLIPAHAGKTAIKRICIPDFRAHPRSRGENARVAPHRFINEGSSPLTRGKHRHGAERVRGQGLIPAHAGKTRSSPRGGRPSWAHPRSRGENPASAATSPLPKGSSPLTRGKRHARRDGRRRARLIPAHAGKTQGARGAEVSARAHPRSRGENMRGTRWCLSC